MICILLRVTTVALVQPYNCLSASVVTLYNIGKIKYQNTKSMNDLDNSWDILYMLQNS